MNSKTSVEDDVVFNMDAIEQYSQRTKSLSVGDVVRGVVVHIDREGVLVDVGAKSEGMIKLSELSRDPDADPHDLVKLGETLSVQVLSMGGQDGTPQLSRRRAESVAAWDVLEAARVANETIEAKVTERVKGGLVVDVGLRGFVPASHVGNGSMKANLDQYVGEMIPLKVIEVDKERGKVICSHKLAAEQERLAKRDETIATLTPGQTRMGTVRRLTNYGAFIDLGGIDGLLHVSEMSWSRVNHPSEVLSEGQELEVYILKLDLDSGRISLGLKQILPDPWLGVERQLKVGDVVYGTVTRILPFGAFVQVEGTVEGVVPNSEIGKRKSGSLNSGDEVEVKVIDLRPDERKMTLSIRQASADEEAKQEREVVEEYTAQAAADDTPRFTIGDHLRAKSDSSDDGDDE